ncbi:DUF1870 family protein [Kingella kingae]|uniref:Aca2/YdiL-like domain-containing protein n=1 Tax=Kingella kingae TaxID=504 RepID=UPI00254CB725|nr:DUF1870 family protein [Kingella kingae]MDK4544556.1 DUF1870 family protein [Kingella kingae]MDK4587407.1 DUF1870 family protein [Kingella kingae]MDK4612712.1 DUF1870 family protein [Kingella kingae]MDK4615116.1 DUF1870 family protein [Kingella kingae]MDK4617303.1 DUF1870 family protein [Kingella kingae]
MTPIELKNARILLGLTTDEAAVHLGKMSLRSWQYLEKGERTISHNVMDNITALLTRRQEMIRDLIDTQGINLNHVAVIYHEAPEYCESILEWRFTQSLARTLHFDFGAKLIVFNPEEYFKWLVGREDNKKNRALWAASFQAA